MLQSPTLRAGGLYGPNNSLVRSLSIEIVAKTDLAGCVWNGIPGAPPQSSFSLQAGESLQLGYSPGRVGQPELGKRRFPRKRNSRAPHQFSGSV